jgi:hypothetical protein
MGKIFILVGLLSLYAVARGQEATGKQPTGSRLIARFNPTGLIDPMDERIIGGAEWKILHRLSIGTDASFVFNSAYHPNNRARGYLLSPFIRWYLKKTGHFLELQVFYKQVDYHMHDWLQKEAVNGVGAYEELQDFTLRKEVSGINLIRGGQKILSFSKHLRFEWYVGLGLRWKRGGVRGVPHALYNGPPNSLGESPSVWPSAPAGFGFVWSFR